MGRQITSQLYDWDFNMFELDRASGRRPLSTTTLALLEDQGLLENWLLDRPTVERFLAAAEAAYRGNPYHNAVHAADVTQTAAVIMRCLDQHLRRDEQQDQQRQQQQQPDGGGGGREREQQQQQEQPHDGHAPRRRRLSGGGGGAGSGLSRMERFCIILGSAVHDLGHPGVNNDFLIRSRDKQAIIYNDRSVNENMHCALAFDMALHREGCDIFSRFGDAEYLQARALIVAIVLSTDMAVHFDLLKQFNAAVEACPDVREWPARDRPLLLQMLVHLSDLANPSRPFPLASAWAERVVAEFMDQGDRERAAGLAVSPPCDRTRVCMPAAQLYFLKTFAKPTLDAFAAAAPAFAALAGPCLEETRVKWEFLLQAGVTAPVGLQYPPFPPDVVNAVEAGRAAAAGFEAERQQQLERARAAWRVRQREKQPPPQPQPQDPQRPDPQQQQQQQQQQQPGSGGVK
ncbi:hypothetical protein Rsub_02590 [Raphidocelis subcapitata]|uniref:Phosphodiesterase n=1 Tax=Raphidocelis subcapitata TaxID=307507 RepID=A0A2V0NQH0_9CHLO|nr:hypothetical protein Rsub_02590 [Raphidocelis subcapitata]|eukprot:GBF89886.1 hypothetical protein Rsub_02590 [Raphidocelis subcapitata]